jgi:hypothetical protein
LVVEVVVLMILVVAEVPVPGWKGPLLLETQHLLMLILAQVVTVEMEEWQEARQQDRQVVSFSQQQLLLHLVVVLAEVHHHILVEQVDLVVVAEVIDHLQ